MIPAMATKRRTSEALRNGSQIVREMAVALRRMRETIGSTRCGSVIWGCDRQRPPRTIVTLLFALLVKPAVRCDSSQTAMEKSHADIEANFDVCVIEYSPLCLVRNVWQPQEMQSRRKLKHL